jgi:hypothetical protein
MRTLGLVAATVALLLAVVVGCRSLQGLKPPYHEPAAAVR